jgi:hypothetical protein
MTNYDVRLSSPNYNVNLSNEDQYNIGLNYETPLKSIQYTNLIIDDISSQFNGTTQIFSITVNGEPYTPVNEQQLIISINEVVLSPGIDYQISGSSIYFTNPPASGNEFFGVALQTTADLTRTIAFLIDNGSQDILPGSKGFLALDVSGDIESWTLLSDVSGSIAIDIEKCTYNDFPSNFTSIVGSEFPVLNNQIKNKDDNLTTWNKQINIGDVLNFKVLSCTGIQKCSVLLKLKI